MRNPLVINYFHNKNSEKYRHENAFQSFIFHERRGNAALLT